MHRLMQAFSHYCAVTDSTWNARMEFMKDEEPSQGKVTIIQGCREEGGKKTLTCFCITSILEL